MVHPDLCALLTACSNNFYEQTNMLVAADWCQENNEEELERLLRLLGSTSWTYRDPLFTGSRRYGTPRDDSDFDWVVYTTRDHIKNLCALKGVEVNTNCFGECGIDVATRFGPVNLLIVSIDRQWKAWCYGTTLLEIEKPVTRERAVEVFKAQQKKHGLKNSEDY